MADSTRDIQIRSTDAVATPRINSINIDVFIMILQEVIGEDADDVLRQSTLVQPKAAVTLVLVCKTWKDIVYSTPRFWPIIKLWM